MKSEEFIVIDNSRTRGESLASTLRRQPGVSVISVLDNWTALVAMTEDTHALIAKTFPALSFEPNILHERLAR